MQRKPNKLINEKSPYLLQHAYNPVDWYPWGNEAFERAKAEDKPLFLSIGYASCHWCHVMEKECFEDEEVAALMNQTFVCIKVDREERPDLDGFYMQVCQAMGKNCGWPLNIIMTAEKHPFFAASFIPKHERYGTEGMMSLIPLINGFWRSRRAEAEDYGKEVRNRIKQAEEKTAGKELEEEVLHEAYDNLVMNFDTRDGGFGNYPKFPSPHTLMFLLRYWKRTNEKTALSMVQKTLDAMRNGGIFDQVGFGFHRYSTDAYWLVPHFEKMLYDQALLILVYLEAYQATKNNAYLTVAKETIDYVMRDMTSASGCFFGAEDADSEGEEGKFYLWTENEIRSVLSPEDFKFAVRLFGVESEGNYHERGKSGTGQNILHVIKPINQLAKETGLTLEEYTSTLARIRRVLFENREKRIRPSKDDKILTDWNGLMIAALAKASQVLGDEKYLDAAKKAANFFSTNMIDENGTLFHSNTKGSRSIAGFLDDYAFLAWGFLEIYEADFSDRFLRDSLTLTHKILERFWDERSGGFFFTQEGTEDSVIRRKESYDGALPSGNSVSFLNLLRLARISEESILETTAVKLSRFFSEEVRRSPASHAFMLLGVDFAIGPAYNVILVGSPKEPDVREFINGLADYFAPNVVLSLKNLAEPTAGLFGLSYEKVNGKPTAYVCRNHTCLPPTNEKKKLLELLELS